jgi:hypothetical protein
MVYRSAQRAFRERRQTQLSELQARVKQYEQGQVERSVTLQSIGIRLKAENETLKEQNAKLKEENERLKAQLDALVSPTTVDNTFAATQAVRSIPTSGFASATLHRGVKRGRVESPSTSAVSLKRSRMTESPLPNNYPLDTPRSSSGHSVSSHAGNEHFTDNQYDSTSPITEDGDNGLDQDAYVAHVSCGMCTSSVDCICRELGIAAPVDYVPNEDGDVGVSILDHLPPYQSATGPPAHAKLPPPPKGLLFATAKEYTTQGGGTSPGCSGNPRDCPACKDSEFGRAFCSALGNSVCTLNPCPTCQSKATPEEFSPKSEDTVMILADEPTLPLTINPTLTQCCGDPRKCKGGACSPAPAAGGSKATSRETSGQAKPSSSHTHRTTRKAQTPPTTFTSGGSRSGDTVSCDIVWRALEAHPNGHLANPASGPSQLANLNLLADVVARRSYCTLAPGEPTPEPEDFPRRARARQHPNPGARTRERGRVNAMMDTTECIFGDHADPRVAIAYADEQGGERGDERMMVPHKVLQGHQRITTVPKEGMRDAIALLDQQFGSS